jgi:farnesyl diphosphate synthase
LSATVLTPTDESLSMAAWVAAIHPRVEAALERSLARTAGPAPVLARAMRYAVMAGGKRIRPLLVHAAGALGAAPEPLLDGCASAVELIHTYSLIHDDLPCMDDDDLRRGRPTTHRVFGEAQALLTGDALQTLAFESLVDGWERSTRACSERLEPAALAAMVGCLARASGASGMAGGQSIDLDSIGKSLSRDGLETMHRMKTGALLGASIRLGALAAGLDGSAQGTAAAIGELAAVDRFAERIGLAFQVVDDVLDVVSDSATLGKTAGKDAADDKPTYVSLMGVDAARAFALELHAEALAALTPFAGRGQRLAGLADLIVNRSC